MSGDATPFDLAHFLPYQLSVLAARVSREFAARYSQRFGISIAEWRVLAHLSQQDAVSVREIHARVEMDKSKVSRAAQRLESAGLIEKRVPEGDRRLVALSLTDKGRALMAEIVPLARQFECELTGALGPEDAERFRELVEQLLEKARG
ncbi:MAG: MarR family transcriptional regulator [Alphaproteobacteria bacterium]|nr:MAG: MarR family transcriptional regulator [Alphaproteobacteria bacterium]